jgi:hypothetical protein
MTAIVDLETLNNIINSNDLILIKKAAFELMQISDYKNAKKMLSNNIYSKFKGS